MRRITVEDVPAWYDLRVLSKGIVLEINALAFAGFIRGLGMLSELSTQIVSREGPGLYLPDFVMPDQCDQWGYAPCLTKQPHCRAGWVAYACQFPQRLPGGWDHELLFCAATLRNVFAALDFEDAETGWSKPQLVKIDPMVVQGGRDGGFLAVEVAPSFARWAKELNEAHVREIKQAMRQTWNWIHPRWQEDLSEFRVLTSEPGSIHLDVPGNATGLDPEMDRFEDRGYVLNGHNVDGPGQQLTLLAGVAKLNELARIDGM